MNNIKLLDCTLRDGGYINDWNFSQKSIKKIIDNLVQSNIDIIECGFIRDEESNDNRSVFNDVKKINKLIYPKNKNTLYVGMIDVPYISIDKINECDGSSIDGIRLTFHENEIDEALLYGKKLMEKGYKVFIQPVGTTCYTDINLLKLIKKVNEMKPYAFYLVDTLGIMYKNDLLRMYHLIDNNLDDSINIGFHSHNNLQLSFSNALELLMLHTKRNIIIDSSVFGMGRGAGNLCTELVTQYINKNIEEKYNVVPLLEIIDEELNKFSTESRWGYSVPYYIAAVNNCHPNYAAYLLNKQTISVKSINTILKQIPISKRELYHQQFIEELYINYQNHLINDVDNLKAIQSLLLNKRVLIIAPGKTIESQMDKIKSFINENNPIIFSVNFIPDHFSINCVFVSNSKRFESVVNKMTVSKNNPLLITTSNITNSKVDTPLVVNYSDLLVDHSNISDNAGLMLINLLNKLCIKNVYLAGFDGFSLDKTSNYFTDDLINNSNIDQLVMKNDAIRKHLMFISRSMGINFVTSTIYNNSSLLIEV